MTKQRKKIIIKADDTNNSDDFLPIVASEEDGDNESTPQPEELPILPVRNTVLFPGVVIPITVGRQKSIKLVKKAYKGDRLLGVIAQKKANADEPTKDDLYEVGTMAVIIKMLTLPDGNTTIIIQGKRKFEVTEIIKDDPYMTAKVKYLEDSVPEKKNKENKALLQSLKDAAMKIIKINPDIPQEAQIALENIESPSFLIHFLSSNVNVELIEKQGLLEITDWKECAEKLLGYMLKEIQLLELKQEIHSKTHTDLDQQQRDYFLRQQIKVLHDELGYDSPEQDAENLKERAAKKKWSKETADHFNKEMSKLLRLNPQSPDYPIALNYLEFMLDLPWQDYTDDSFDLVKAKEILDTDHYGLDKVKTRILEYLAVLKLRKDMKGPILCLYGPPGVGKTSLGKSIAKSLQREYVRMSLGGLHDEGEIRGHRKTYIGAMPGRILTNIKKAKTSNPVFVLDEVDKIGNDFRGDPASALLEVLDPEQNNSFNDNYLEVDYDLSKVLFIATANSLDTIHPALRDRMEIIEINGYTLEEKIEIVKKHLLPKAKKEHGLAPKSFAIDDTAIALVIDGYTRESGVRNLEQKMASIARNIAKSVAMEEEYSKKLKKEDVEKILGMPIFDKDMYQQSDFAGVVTGLAWTQVGGEILFIESSLSKGRGQMTLSGQLGDVMKESATAALSYLKAHAEDLGIDYRLFSQYDLHVHVPAGAVPKDGPSAGITMFTSLASIYTQRKVKDKLAMTGEITLRGKVLPVGGIKEKILAARRAGIKEIILCKQNRKDIQEIEQRYIDDLTIHYVDKVEDVLAIALLSEKVKKAMIFKIDNNNNNNDKVN
jgi:ATP-dependent Lon protease